MFVLYSRSNKMRIDLGLYPKLIGNQINALVLIDIPLLEEPR
jgi:hypothetical protein